MLTIGTLLAAMGFAWSPSWPFVGIDYLACLIGGGLIGWARVTV